MDTVVEQKMPAVAMTDHGNLFGAVQFYKTAKAKGMHPVIGCEVSVSQQGHKTRSDTDATTTSSCSAKPSLHRLPGRLVFVAGKRRPCSKSIPAAGSARMEAFACPISIALHSTRKSWEAIPACAVCA
jgi:hypothetical protein